MPLTDTQKQQLIINQGLDPSQWEVNAQETHIVPKFGGGQQMKGPPTVPPQHQQLFARPSSGTGFNSYQQNGTPFQQQFRGTNSPLNPVPSISQFPSSNPLGIGSTHYNGPPALYNIIDAANRYNNLYDTDQNRQGADLINQQSKAAHDIISQNSDPDYYIKDLMQKLTSQYPQFNQQD